MFKRQPTTSKGFFNQQIMQQRLMMKNTVTKKVTQIEKSSWESHSDVITFLKNHFVSKMKNEIMIINCF